MIDKGTILVRIFSVQHSIQYDGLFTPYHFLVFVLKEKYDSVLPKHKEFLSVVSVYSSKQNKALFRIEVGHQFSLRETQSLSYLLRSFLVSFTVKLWIFAKFSTSSKVQSSLEGLLFLNIFSEVKN